VKENSLRELHLEDLKDLYSAENQLVKALPKMASAATSPDLKAGFEKHLEQTREHGARLEQIGEEMTEKLTGKT
jgi:ferritin-like metal-binding protein YciE